MKVTIIGGGGFVGSCTAFALQCGGVVREIALLDVNLELAEGQALDCCTAAPSTADQVITPAATSMCRRATSSASPPACGASRTKAGWI